MDELFNDTADNRCTDNSNRPFPFGPYGGDNCIFHRMDRVFTDIYPVAFDVGSPFNDYVEYRACSDKTDKFLFVVPVIPS